MEKIDVCLFLLEALMKIVFEGVELNRVDGQAIGRQLEVVRHCHQSVGTIMEFASSHYIVGPSRDCPL